MRTRMLLIKIKMRYHEEIRKTLTKTLTITTTNMIKLAMMTIIHDTDDLEIFRMTLRLSQCL